MGRIGTGVDGVTSEKCGGGMGRARSESCFCTVRTVAVHVSVQVKLKEGAGENLKWVVHRVARTRRGLLALLP